MLASSWSDLGAVQTLRRLLKMAEARLGEAIVVPEHLLFEDFELSVGCVTNSPFGALEALHAVRQARVNVDRSHEGLPPLRLPEMQVPDTEDATDARLFTAACRLAVGELAESVARVHALAHASVKQASADLPPEFARLVYDSYVAAVWSSAHAEYVVNAKELLAMMPAGTKVADVSIPPGPYTVSWAVTSLPDLVHLLDRRGTSAASRINVDKAVTVMQTLLNRCTSSSSRGWETAINTAGKDGEGALRVCAAACVAALTGMSLAIHPAARGTWEERMRIQRSVTFAANEPRKMLALCGAGSREAMRLYLAAILANSPCVREALFVAGHPAGGLLVSPFEPASTPLQVCSATLASIGKLALRGVGIGTIMNGTFSDENRRAQKRPDVLVPTVAAASASKAQPYTATTPSLLTSVSALVADVFSAQFTPFWNVMHCNQVRVSRLSQVQHSFFHKQNIIHRLFDLMPEDRQLFVQRVALTDPRSCRLTAAEVGAQLGHEVPAGGKLASFSSTAAAELVLYARVAAMKQICLAWDLGPRIRALQVRALAKRLVSDVHQGDDVDAAAARIPKTATHLCVCVECRRVCNSMNLFQGKDLSHTEVGISSAMLRVEGELSCGTMRCAKRSSASLRTALQLEADAESGEQNVKETDKQGPVSKLRRDRRSCLAQVGQAVACGDEDLVLVPVLGRVVQLFGSSYVLCCFCGTLVNLLPNNRFQGEPCCMRCDLKLCTRDRPEYPHPPQEEEAHVHCRFCGKRDSLPKSLSKWKSFHAPQDDLGPNASVPPPLRRVTYCTSHSKPWVAAAHRSQMSMSEIFAHLSLRIKPVLGASVQERRLLTFRPVMEGAAITKPTKIRKKRAIRNLRR